MDQYLLIPFLVGWTSIYQLFLCSPGVQGFDTLPFVIPRVVDKQMSPLWSESLVISYKSYKGWCESAVTWNLRRWETASSFHGNPWKSTNCNGKSLLGIFGLTSWASGSTKPSYIKLYVYIYIYMFIINIHITYITIICTHIYIEYIYNVAFGNQTWLAGSPPFFIIATFDCVYHITWKGHPRTDPNGYFPL